MLKEFDGEEYWAMQYEEGVITIGFHTNIAERGREAFAAFIADMMGSIASRHGGIGSYLEVRKMERPRTSPKMINFELTYDEIPF